jgi:hypothetical protein
MSSADLDSLLDAVDDELLPEPDRVTEAKARAKKLIADLHKMEKAWMFEVDDAVPHGSHARETAIVDFKDIDYLVVLNQEALLTTDGAERTARDTVGRLASALRARRGGLVAQGTIQVRSQKHSVGVKYPGSRLRVDLVPARRTDERGCFLIPDRSIDRWVETRPHQLKRYVTLAEGTNPNVRAAIRLIKGWRRARGKAMQIPSYAIELLLGRWAADESGLEGLVRVFFERFAGGHARQRLVLLGDSDNAPVTVRDPWSSLNVTDELSADHRARLVENAGRALYELDEAASLVGMGRERGALGVLRRLFKGNYE